MQILSQGKKIGTKIKKIIVWSDGGLKNKLNTLLFHDLAKQYKVQFCVNYFAPSPCVHTVTAPSASVGPGPQ